MTTHVCLSCMPSVTSMPGPLSFMITIQCAPSSSKRASTVAEAPARSLKDQILTARLVPDGSGINQSESGALDSLRCSIRSIPKIGWSTPALYAKSCCQGFRCFKISQSPDHFAFPASVHASCPAGLPGASASEASGEPAGCCQRCGELCATNFPHHGPGREPTQSIRSQGPVHLVGAWC